MPVAVNGVSIIATKLASGNVQLVFQNANGGIQYAVVIPSADFTAINTSVNGSSTGASLSKQYAQDTNKGDYPQHYFHGEGN